MNTWAVPGYTETRELGSGASGRVALAVHEDTGLPVAVKYLSESLRTRPGFVAEFRAEARLLGGLGSRYVAGLYEYVEGPDGAAIVMELVDGLSLRRLLTREAPLAPEAALTLLKGSLLGLADAHRLGVVHRDYKPENVLVTADGHSKLVDFGIAATDGTTAGIAGTPSYMAPEQWTGAPASPAADVYAATATFFECLTGRKPYTGDNMAELALKHVDGPIPADEVPEALRPLVLRGLAKSPGQRPPDAADFVAELETAAGGAYGADWEERGRGRLAALVALSLLLLPSAPRTSHSATDTARTVLSQHPGGFRSWLPGGRGLLVSGAALVAALLLAHGVDPGTADTPQQAAQALATTSTQPDVSAGPTGPTEAGSPSSPAADGTSPPPASGTADGSSARPSASASAGSGAATPTAGTTGAPTTTPAAPAAVKDVTLTGFQQTGSTTGTATLTVTTDGTGPVTLGVTWFTGDTRGQSGTQDGAASTYERSGSTRYTLPVEHTFRGTGCYWGVRATTNPAPTGGDAWQQLLTRACDLR
ncbi:protein kinase [Streptomyces sp. NPDC005551]|uniref:serine/threonine-protein kinase n=1 Tax=unclassified Streptomyces TaxID=2593676 RepID=UPI0033FD5686